MTSGEDAPTIDVRQVTQLHAQWADGGADQPGSFVLTVLLDDGAQSVEVTAPVKVLQAALPLIAAGQDAVLDLGRGAVVIGHLEISTDA